MFIWSDSDRLTARRSVWTVRWYADEQYKGPWWFMKTRLCSDVTVRADEQRCDSRCSLRWESTDSSCCWQRAWWYFRLSLHSCFAPASDSLYTSTCFMFNSSHSSLIAEETLINTSNNIITSKYVHAQRAVIRKCVFIITAVFSNICFPKIFTAIFSTTTANKNTITCKY